MSFWLLSEEWIGWKVRGRENVERLLYTTREEMKVAWTEVVVGKRGEVNRWEGVRKRWMGLDGLNGSRQQREASRPPAPAQVSRLGPWQVEVPLLSKGMA